MAQGNVHLTPELVRAVREAVDIVSIASEHTRLTKTGRRYKGVCPLHKEKTPSFSVDPDQGLFYCFGCGQGGDAIKLHMLASGDDFPAAIESLALRFGVPLPAAGPARRGEIDSRAVLEAAQKFFVEQLGRHRAARDYLERRQIDPELAGRFGLGYAPDGWQNLLEALRPKIPVEHLEKTGLVARSERAEGRLYDRFRHRLMFPIRSPTGRIVGFGGRTLGDDPAKYVNTAETADFHKGTLLYGLDVAKKALRETGRVLLVEGYFDVLGAFASGIDWAVASMGTALTPEQVQLLERFAGEVVVGYDADNAGEAAHRRALPLLLAKGFTVRRARFGAGEDPDSLRVKAGPDAVARAVADARDAVEEEIDRLAPDGIAKDPRAQSQAVEEITALLSPIPEATLRYAYARRAADLLSLPGDLLARKIARRDASPTPAAQPTLTREGARPAGALTHSQEDELLARLLADPADPPPISQLPPAEAFLDPVCRNIYRSLRDLYEVTGALPAARAVAAALENDSDAVARVALYQNEVEYPAGSRRLGLRECLDAVMHRWTKERLRELTNEIRAAERRGDPEGRIKSLLDERVQLSQRRFGAPPLPGHRPASR